MDLLASWLQDKLKSFDVRSRDPQASAVDALITPWGQFNMIYAFSPLQHLPCLLLMIKMKCIADWGECCTDNSNSNSDLSVVLFESSWPCVPKASLPSCFLVLALSAIPLKPMSSGTGDCQRWSSLPSWSLGRCCLLTKSSITPGSPILSGTRPINVIQRSTPLTILSFVKGVAHISHLVHFLLLRGTLTCFFRPFRGCPSSPLGMSNLTCKVAFLNAITSEWRVSELAILAFSGVTQAQGCPEA